ncbi:MAG: sucrase ferredoxin [Chloroflexota bacterium]
MKPKRQYCNTIALEHNLDVGGTANPITRMIGIETPLPWKSPAYLSLNERIRPIYEKIITAPNIADLLRELRVTQFLLLAPNGESEPDHTRVIIWEDRPEPFAIFKKKEYLIPTRRLGYLAQALTFKPKRLIEFEKWAVEATTTRDFLVCTHGARDIACAKFGYPLYNSLLKQTDEQTRIWRASHFGGHVFAPTMIEFPTGIYWAYVWDDRIEQIVQRSGDIAQLQGCYRGWSGAGYGWPQVAERELVMQEGWSLLKRPRKVHIVAQDSAESPLWTEVEIEVLDTINTQRYCARVERKDPLPIPVESQTLDKLYPYPQYEVVELRQVF